MAALAAAPAFIRNAYAQEGLTAKAITIGSTGATTGPLAGVGAELKLGVDAAMGQINAKGGVNGRVLQFQMLDDGYVPQRSADNVKKMIGDGSIFALMSCVGTPNNTAIVPLIEESNLPYVGPRSGASSLRKPGMRNVFHVRASFTDETQRLVQRIVEHGHQGPGRRLPGQRLRQGSAGRRQPRAAGAGRQGGGAGGAGRRRQKPQ
jgi:branched-chain amino acid transport system substrate-binding protein